MNNEIWWNLNLNFNKFKDYLASYLLLLHFFYWISLIPEVLLAVLFSVILFYNFVGISILILCLCTTLCYVFWILNGRCILNSLIHVWVSNMFAIKHFFYCFFAGFWRKIFLRVLLVPQKMGLLINMKWFVPSIFDLLAFKLHHNEHQVWEHKKSLSIFIQQKAHLVPSRIAKFPLHQIDF